MKHTFRFGLLFTLILAIVVALAPAGVARSASAPVVRLKPIGHPTWKPVDFHVFSAPIGTADSGYVEFGQTMEALLPVPNHKPNPLLGIGPGAPHQPPYNTEFAQGVAAKGYVEAPRFTLSQFSQGNGVWMVWMNVPNPGTTGSSPDFASGPIIPNSLFPIHVHADDIHNGKPTDVVVDTDVPALDTSVDPSFNVDGHSHFPFFLADGADFVPAPIRGSYKYRTTMIDQQGNGWLIEAEFAVASR